MTDLTTAHPTPSTLLQRSAFITGELTHLYAELALMRQSELRVRRATFETLAAQGENVTFCREQAQLASTESSCEVIRLQGDIDGNLNELRDIDRQLQYAYGAGGYGSGNPNGVH